VQGWRQAAAHCSPSNPCENGNPPLLGRRLRLREVFFMGMANADTKRTYGICPACGGRLIVFVRVRRGEDKAPLAYFKCERCAHVVIEEE
jgi:hypothetical protein